MIKEFENGKLVVTFEGLVDGKNYFEKKNLNWKDVRVYNFNDSLCYSSRIKNRESQILSNMYMCSIFWNGIRWNSLEQLYHYLCHSESPDVQEDILKCKSSFEVKKLVGNKKLDSDYEKKRYKVLEFCMRLKYEYCEEFREVLMNSGDKDLVEYSEWGDVVYGCCKCNVNGEDMLMGINGCGRIMMKVRRDMRGK